MKINSRLARSCAMVAACGLALPAGTAVAAADPSSCAPATITVPTRTVDSMAITQTDPKVPPVVEWDGTNAHVVWGGWDLSVKGVHQTGTREVPNPAYDPACGRPAAVPEKPAPAPEQPVAPPAGQAEHKPSPAPRKPAPAKPAPPARAAGHSSSSAASGTGASAGGKGASSGASAPPLQLLPLHLMSAPAQG